jgi:hypothetical protein
MRGRKEQRQSCPPYPPVLPPPPVSPDTLPAELVQAWEPLRQPAGTGPRYSHVPSESIKQHESLRAEGPVERDPLVQLSAAEAASKVIALLACCTRPMRRYYPRADSIVVEVNFLAGVKKG